MVFAQPDPAASTTPWWVFVIYVVVTVAGFVLGWYQYSWRPGSPGDRRRRRRQAQREWTRRERQQVLAHLARDLRVLEERRGGQDVS